MFWTCWSSKKLKFVVITFSMRNTKSNKMNNLRMEWKLYAFVKGEINRVLYWMLVTFLSTIFHKWIITLRAYLTTMYINSSSKILRVGNRNSIHFPVTGRDRPPESENENGNWNGGTAIVIHGCVSHIDSRFYCFLKSLRELVS